MENREWKKRDGDGGGGGGAIAACPYGSTRGPRLKNKTHLNASYFDIFLSLIRSPFFSLVNNTIYM